MMNPSNPINRIIWSVCHTGGWNADYIIKVIDKAAEQGVHGIELSGRYVDPLINYRNHPALQACIDPQVHAKRRDDFHRICEHITKRKLRLGIWHHEIASPDTADKSKSLLDILPALRAGDGLIDLESPLLYQLIADRLGEFLDLYPAVNEIVLTMTETAFPVMDRPFSKIPVTERIGRVIATVLQAVESRGRQLVVRPFSAMRIDEENMRKVLQEIKSKNVSAMYKTEPFDWHPFLMNEPLIGSVHDKPARAEVDAAGEYYGQTVFPCCFVDHLHYRFSAAIEKGATSATLRVDRGYARTVLDHPVNEINLIATTQWLKNPQRPVGEHMLDWTEKKFGVRSPQLISIFNRTFDVMKHAFYIDQQSISHHRFPTLDHAKHIQVFGLLEPNIPLTHMQRNWGVLSERSTLSHKAVLTEKQKAVDIASQLLHEIKTAKLGLKNQDHAVLVEQFERLEFLARALQQWCRVILSHLREIWAMKETLVDSFEIESQRLVEMSHDADRKYGEEFFGFGNYADKRDPSGMGRYMRTLTDGLLRERQSEIPLRREIAKIPGLLDAVLCGFASEGHRLSKKLHTGSTPMIDGRCVRLTGLGEHESVAYLLETKPNVPMKLQITFASPSAGKRITGIVEIASKQNAFEISADGKPLQIREFSIPAQTGSQVPVNVWSSCPQPLTLAQILLTQA